MAVVLWFFSFFFFFFFSYSALLGMTSHKFCHGLTVYIEYKQSKRSKRYNMYDSKRRDDVHHAWREQNSRKCWIFYWLDRLKISQNNSGLGKCECTCEVWTCGVHVIHLFDQQKKCVVWPNYHTTNAYGVWTVIIMKSQFTAKFWSPCNTQSQNLVKFWICHAVLANCAVRMISAIVYEKYRNEKAILNDVFVCHV